MSKYLIKKSTIVEICDAIRAKNNTTTQYTINDIADAILDLKGVKEKYKVLIDYTQPISFGGFTINTNEYTESLNILPIKPLLVNLNDKISNINFYNQFIVDNNMTDTINFKITEPIRDSIVEKVGDITFSGYNMSTNINDSIDIS